MSSPNIFKQIDFALLDLQQATSQTFDVPLKKLGRLLETDVLSSANAKLTAGQDLKAFLQSGERSGGSMVGSHHLDWPDEPLETLGLQLMLVKELASDPQQATQFAFQYYSSGNKIIANINTMTRSLIIPFFRDYKEYVLNDGRAAPMIPLTYSKRIFIVHGHDVESRESVARFVERLGLEAVILHEQANQGRTVIEKVEANSDVGFAIVLLTPDDEGRCQGEALKPRARQNVLLELGYFIGKLGRNRVCALKRGDVDLPSDFAGVVWESLDGGGAWKQSLGRELSAAGYEIDWNRIMR